MPSAQELQHQFGEYRGAMPCPSDFDLFWKDRMAEADAVGLDYARSRRHRSPMPATCQLFDLWYTGMCGARLHAKYLKPVSDEPVPLVLQFHGYPGASRSWFEQASFAGMGHGHSSPSTAPAKEVPPRILVDLKARRLPGISLPVSTATRPISTMSACTKIFASCAASFASSRASIFPVCL